MELLQCRTGVAFPSGRTRSEPAEPILDAEADYLVLNKPMESVVEFVLSIAPAGLCSVEDLDAQHWVTNLTSPVLFATAFEQMCFESPSSDKLNVDLIVEIGAHSTMSGPIRQILNKRSLPYVSCLKRVPMQWRPCRIWFVRWSPVDIQ